MKQEELKHFLRKKVKINTTDGVFYTAEILELGEESVLIKDKFQNLILISYDNIERIAGHCWGAR
jgi:hypothetical protein